MKTAQQCVRPHSNLESSLSLRVYETNFVISLLKRAFKVMKNGVYFMVITFLVAKLFNILIYANYRTCDVTMWTQNDVK